MTLSISVLGPLIVNVDGNPIAISKKGGALLAYLACQKGAAISRTKVADLLWPLNSFDALHSLRNCLCDLRKHKIGQRDLFANNIHCRLREATADVEHFEQTSIKTDTIAELNQAISLYRGPFLDDLIIKSEPWNEWADAERTRLQGIQLTKLFSLANLCSLEGNHHASVEAGRRGVALDPLSEPMNRRLMRVLMRAGRNTEAARHYEHCVQLYWDELRVTPSRQTVDLYQEMRGLGANSALSPP